MKTKPKKIGWAMCRVSTKEQGKVQHGSLEQQNNRIQRWLEDRQADSHTEYVITRIIAEERSGRKEKYHLRRKLHELEAAIDSRQIDFFVIENVKRFVRWNERTLTILRKATENGVEPWSVDQGPYNPYDRGSRIRWGLESLLAEDESDETRERVIKKQREAMVNNGKDGATMPCLGLDPHPEKTGMYCSNHDELKTVVTVMTKFCELKSLKLTVKFCEESGYKTKVRWTREAVGDDGTIKPKRLVGGESFDEQRLRNLLINPKLRGFNTFRDDYDQFPKVQDHNKMVQWKYHHHRKHGDLISSDLFARVDKTLAGFECHRPRTKHKNGNVYFLTGVLRDHHGNPFHGVSGKSGQNRYYRNRTKDPTQKKTIKKEDIEEIAIKRIKQFFRESATLQEVFTAALNNRLVGLPLIEEELPGVEKTIQDLEKMIGRFSDSIRQVAIEPTGDLAKVCVVLMSEKVKAERELVDANAERSRLLERKEMLLQRFKPKTLEHYLNKTMEMFVTKS